MSPALAILIAAVIRVESSGNSGAVGKRGEVGLLQIRPALVQDVQRIAPQKHFTLEDRRSARCVEMFRAYVEHYATEERIGREVTPEDMARIWNGGPNGWRRKSTLPYWVKVRAEMKKESRHE